MRRVLLWLVAAICLSGCGEVPAEEGAAPQRAADETLQAPPPIEAIDEPAPGWPPPAPWEREKREWTEYTVCWNERGETECKPKQIEELREQQLRSIERTRPAPDSEPRKVARLQAGDVTVNLIAWKTRAGELCTAVESWTGGTGSGGPSGPCLVAPGCPELCLRQWGSDDVWLVAGTVSSHADRLRIVWRDGAASEYPLTGPLVPGFPNDRVYLLGGKMTFFRELELLAGDEVIARAEVPAEELRMRDCLERAASPPDEGAAGECVEEGSRLKPCSARS